MIAVLIIAILIIIIMSTTNHTETFNSIYDNKYIFIDPNRAKNKVVLLNNDNMITIINSIRRDPTKFIDKTVFIAWLWNNTNFTKNNRNLFAQYDLNPKYMKLPLEANDYDVVLDIHYRHNVTKVDTNWENHESFDINDVSHHLFIHNDNNINSNVSDNIDSNKTIYYLAIAMNIYDQSKDPFVYMYSSDSSNLNNAGKTHNAVKNKLRMLASLIIKEAFTPPYFHGNQCRDQRNSVNIVTYQIFKISFVTIYNSPFIWRIDNIDSNDKNNPRYLKFLHNLINYSTTTQSVP